MASEGECVTNNLKGITALRYPSDVSPYVGEEKGLNEMPCPPRMLSAYRANMYESSNTDDAATPLRILAPMIMQAVTRTTIESILPTRTLWWDTVSWPASPRDLRKLVIDLNIRRELLLDATWQAGE
jgi:hypothetical protein